MDRLELMKGLLQLVINQIDKKGDNYKSKDIWYDLLNVMRLNATTLKKEVDEFIEKQLQNFEDEEIKKDELIEILSEIITNKYIILIDSCKLVMDFEWFDNSTFCEELEEEIKESYNYKIIEDIDEYVRTIIFYGVQKKINEILEEIAKNIENVKIKDIIEYLK